jgi:predicted amidohydrolase YtcJ
MRNMMRIARTALLAGTLTGWGGAALAIAPGYPIPDEIFVNGHIYTGKFGQFVHAVAVKDGDVVATGEIAAMRKLAGPSTKIIDFGGHTVIPGFYDSHIHVGYEERREMLVPSPNLKGVKDLADLQDRLRKFAATVPPGSWIRGEIPHATGGHEAFTDATLPKKADLDAAVPNNPVALNRGAHIMLVNSKALAAAKFTKGTPQPGGGHFDLDANGEPDGVVREAPGKRVIMSAFPPLPPVNDAEGIAYIKSRLYNQLALGVTSVNIPGLRPHDDIRMIQELYDKEGEDLPRVTFQLRVYPGYDAYDDPKEGVAVSIKEIAGIAAHTGFGNERLKIGAVKMSVDGAFGGQSAWLIDSYPGRPNFHGQVRIPPDALYAVGKFAYDHGWQLGVHAIGDEAVRQTVLVFDRIIRENPRPDPRLYLHHMSVKPPQDILDIMKKDGIIASMQPNFTYTIAPFYKTALSPAKLASNNPERSLWDMGIHMAQGSDGLPDGPMVGIYGAVTRHGIDGSLNGPEERLTLEQALYNATVGSAYMTFDEKRRGTLEAGKVADMVVLPEDIFAIDPEKIRTMQVDETIIGGKIVWINDAEHRAQLSKLKPMGEESPE